MYPHGFYYWFSALKQDCVLLLLLDVGKGALHTILTFQNRTIPICVFLIASLAYDPSALIIIILEIARSLSDAMRMRLGKTRHRLSRTRA